MTALLVMLGAAAGAVGRHLLGAWAKAALRATASGATLLVNVLGSALLGLLAAVAEPTSAWWALLGVGLCGALTTFSSHALAVADALRGGRRRQAVADLAVSVVACMLAVTLGWETGSLLG